MEAGTFLSVSTSLTASWGSRKESVDACADRLALCLRGLADAHELLGTWFRRGRSEEAAGQPVSRDRETLRSLLLAGRRRRDSDGGVIDELGFSASLWNGRSAATSFRATVGAYPRAANVMNTFALSLPAAADGGRELYEPAVARRIIAAVVDSWEPDGARWTSVSLYRAQEPKPREHVIGWFTYLASRLSRPAELLERAGGQPFGHGYLFTLSERAEDVCVESALSLKHELTEVGVLARTP